MNKKQQKNDSDRSKRRRPNRPNRPNWEVIAEKTFTGMTSNGLDTGPFAAVTMCKYPVYSLHQTREQAEKAISGSCGYCRWMGTPRIHYVLDLCEAMTHA